MSEGLAFNHLRIDLSLGVTVVFAEGVHLHIPAGDW